MIEDRPTRHADHQAPASVPTPELLPEYRDFTCTCADVDRGHCRTVMEDVCATLEADPAEITTRVSYALSVIEDERNDSRRDPWCYVDITGIAVDMWSRIDATVHRHLDDDELVRRGVDPMSEDVERFEPIATIAVACDLLEHGFARLYQLAREAVREHAPYSLHV